MSVPVHTIYKEELSDILTRWYDMITEIPKYDKDSTVKNGERAWAMGKFRKTVRKLYFRKTFYFCQITPAFF